MGFIPGPHQVDLILERVDLRSVNTNLMGHLTWPAASLQARLWERLARSGRKSSASAGLSTSSANGSPSDHQRILMYKQKIPACAGMTGISQRSVSLARHSPAAGAVPLMQNHRGSDVPLDPEARPPTCCRTLKTQTDVPPRPSARC